MSTCKIINYSAYTVT